jgi:hypothetical protein
MARKSVIAKSVSNDFGLTCALFNRFPEEVIKLSISSPLFEIDDVTGQAAPGARSLPHLGLIGL